MLINVKTAPRPPSKTLTRRIEATLRYRLARFSEAVARVEVHVSDRAPGSRSNEKRCTIEIQPKGLAPVAVAQEAPIFEYAFAGLRQKAWQLSTNFTRDFDPVGRPERESLLIDIRHFGSAMAAGRRLDAGQLRNPSRSKA